MRVLIKFEQDTLFNNGIKLNQNFKILNLKKFKPIFSIDLFINKICPLSKEGKNSLF